MKAFIPTEFPYVQAAIEAMEGDAKMIPAHHKAEIVIHYLTTYSIPTYLVTQYPAFTNNLSRGNYPLQQVAMLFEANKNNTMFIGALETFIKDTCY